MKPSRNHRKPWQRRKSRANNRWMRRCPIPGALLRDTVIQTGTIGSVLFVRCADRLVVMHEEWILMPAAFKHCDEYIREYDAPNVLRWFLFVNRLPASEGMLCRVNGVRPKLFADYKGGRVRVVMASRMGDVGITTNLDVESGYQDRVAVEALSNFGAQP